ncbi:class I SAM-dependent DNA methyltransferase [Amnibacterium endophyticum]|uniref:site-specific DNA-methyltransferase (adenine-specific) n=1 Tax=Amnibacterium endophyticum TaxID=2109337 RepID=A0ABW4LC71_9MICO
MVAPNLSMREIRNRAGAFAARWSGDHYERGESQSFWNEFLAIFGIDRKRVAYFEKRADRFSTGRGGFIDLFWPGMLLVEQKSLGKDLEVADAQAFDYLDRLSPRDFPIAVVVSDFARIRLTRFGENGPETTLFETRDLAKEIDRFTFLAGYVQRDFSAAHEEAVNARAVELLSVLYRAVVADHFTDHEASVFITRVLFLLFGDDTGLWARGLFHDLVDRTPEDGESLAGVLESLFRALDRPEDQRSSRLSASIAPFPYVNGGLFNEHIEVPPFDSAMREALLDCCRFDWGSISPDVFGSMFQAVKSKEDRRAHGEHYTTPENIAKTIDPLFMDGLRSQLSAAGASVTRLRALQKSLGLYRFLDPACGCGNFLVVAYREMRAFELEIMRRIRQLTNTEVLGGYHVADELQVRPDQFYGIEIEEWPAAIARTALFLVDHQANMELAQEFGEAPDRLPIRDAATIVIGNAIRLDWSSVVAPTDTTFVFGNPPFVGMAWMSESQQEDNRLAFAGLEEARGERTGRLDYVACWYAKALRYACGRRVRFAFVSTNSLSQGDQARALDPIFRRAGMTIDFGHRTFKWSSGATNAAAVYCVIIGFSRTGTTAIKRLFDYPDIAGQPLETKAVNINFYLVDSDLPGPAKRSKPLLAGLPDMSKGSQPTDGGHLIVAPNNYDEVAADSIATKYLRPFRQSKEMLYALDRWCLWLDDAAPSDLVASPVLRSRLNGVREARAASPTASVRSAASSPARFTQDRQPHTAYLALPEVSGESRDYIPMRYFEPDVIAGNKLILVPECPLWLFTYLQSAAFTAWVKAFAGRLKADPSISPDLTYCVFPFLEPGSKRARFEQAGKRILEARAEFPAENLATLYNPLAMPQTLRSAHLAADRLVDGMYGLTRPTESARVAALLKAHHWLIGTIEQPLELRPVP